MYYRPMIIFIFLSSHSNRPILHFGCSSASLLFPSSSFNSRFNPPIATLAILPPSAVGALDPWANSSLVFPFRSNCALASKGMAKFWPPAAIIRKYCWRKEVAADEALDEVIWAMDNWGNDWDGPTVELVEDCC